MYHSSYVASKLGIWKERGRKRLIGLLAKMGYVPNPLSFPKILKEKQKNRFSILQTQQPYAHMDMDLKKELMGKLSAIAPEYGLVELSYPSFMRCFGYKSQPLSAADAVEAISALLDVAGGVRMEIEIEGARNGGEWFGGGRVWETSASKKKDDDRSGLLPLPADVVADAKPVESNGGEEPGKIEVQWWVKNFWAAFDALVE
jgi:cell division control protein 45